MATPLIRDFMFDDANEAKFAAHGITVPQVDAILDHRFATQRNRKGRRGLYLVVGRDGSGVCIATPVEPTHVPGLWRPITAWYCKPSEKAPS